MALRSKLQRDLFAAVLCVACAALAAKAAPAPGNARLVVATSQQYQQHIVNLRKLVDECGANAAACDASHVGDDDRVQALGFEQRWGWLRGLLTNAKDAKPEERSASMKSAAQRLEEIANEGSVTASDPVQFTKARADATAILNSSEFQNVEELSWWARKRAQFFLWLSKLFSGMGNMGLLGEFLLTGLEILIFAAAGVGLILFIRRSLARQRMAVALHNTPGEAGWAREANDWAAQADASAEREDWRDAVHSLYWATIVMLEGRRAWRHNPTRTPREYVRLLQPGSAQQRALRAMTQLFERLWYGLREASIDDYEAARVLYVGLRDKSPASTEAT